MFVVELRFDDNEQRLAARPAHRERLNKLHEQGLLKLAGPWADDSGALLIFSTDDEGVKKIMAEDPYYSMAGVTVLSLREWKPIAGETARIA